MIRQGIAKLQRQAIATLILLAILIAPLCAPLCGSRACANSRTQNGDCHDSVTVNADTSQINLGSARACASGELPTAALNEAKSSPELLKRIFSLHAFPQFLFSARDALLAVNSTLPGPDNEPHKNSPIEAAVLRI